MLGRGQKRSLLSDPVVVVVLFAKGGGVHEKHILLDCPAYDSTCSVLIEQGAVVACLMPHLHLGSAFTKPYTYPSFKG